MTFLSDVRHAWRSLRRSPGFTAVTIATLVSGMGVTVAMFSVLEGVLWRPLPFHAPERIVRLWESNPAKGHERFDVLWGSFLDWREQSRTFEALALYRMETLLVADDGEPERLQAAMVSPALFRLLRVQPALGRGFLPEEGRRNDEQRAEIVLSHALWQRKFGSDPAIIGKQLTVGGWASPTVVGVMPPNFEFPEGTELWTEEVLTRAMGRGDRWRSAIGRLKTGSTIADARAELNTIASRAQIEHPETNAGWGVVVEPLAEVSVGKFRTGLLALFGGVLALMLIACANVATAVRARAAARRHELAIRTALGATRWRLVRLALAEGLLITAVAGTLGLLVADTLLDILIAIAPAGIPRLDEVGTNSVAVLFTVALSLLTMLVFGVGPWAATQGSGGSDTLERGPGRATRQGWARTGGALVAAQLALSLVLLVGAGILIETFVRLNRLDLGLDASNVWTSDLAVPVGRFAPPQGLRVGGAPDWHRLATFFPAALDRVRALPGIESAALVDVPPGGTETPDFFQYGRRFAADPANERWPAVAHVITPDYFRVLRIALRSGRTFTDDDRPSQARLTRTGPAAPGVAIVNEAMAQRYWPGRDPIGEDIVLEGDSVVQYRAIVGVVGNTRRSPLEQTAEPIVYVPLAQKPRFELTLIVRTAGGDRATSESLRDELRRFDQALSVPAFVPLEHVLGAAMARHRFGMILVSIFGVLALLITAAGLYGVIAFIVSQRTREIGIRMALGARTPDVARMVVGYALVPVLGGLAAGTLGAFWAGRSLPVVVAGARAADPGVLLAGAGLVVVAAALAVWAPARRASSVDPISVLKAE